MSSCYPLSRYQIFPNFSVSLTDASLEHKMRWSLGSVIDTTGLTLHIMTRLPVHEDIIRLEWESRTASLSHMPGNWTRYYLFTHNHTLVSDLSESARHVTRVEVTSPLCDVNIWAFHHMDSKSHTMFMNAWFSQCHRVAKCSSTFLDLSRVEIGMCIQYLAIFASNGIATATESWYSLHFTTHSPKPSHEFQLWDTFLCDSGTRPPKRPKKTYLFIQDLEVDLKQRFIHTPAMYWTSDRAGKKRLSPKQLEEYLDHWELSPEDLRIHVDFCGEYLTQMHYDALREIHVALGFDPDSNEMAKALGLPILEINPLYRRFSEG